MCACPCECLCERVCVCGCVCTVRESMCTTVKSRSRALHKFEWLNGFNLFLFFLACTQRPFTVLHTKNLGYTLRKRSIRFGLARMKFKKYIGRDVVCCFGIFCMTRFVVKLFPPKDFLKQLSPCYFI